MLKKTLISVLGLAFLASCSTTYTVSLQREYERDFVGKSHNYIVSAFGAPDRTTSDGNDGQILIYEDTAILSQEVATNVNYNTRTYTPGTYSTTSKTYAHFYVDHYGNCYKVKTNRTEERVDAAKVRQNDKAVGIGLLAWLGIPLVVGLVGLLVGGF